MCKVIAIANQKGGVGKTTTCVNLGIGLAREGKRVLLIEADAQGSMAASLGIQEPDELEVTLVTIMEKVINDEQKESNTFDKYMPLFKEAEITEKFIKNIEQVFASCNIGVPFGQANVQEWLGCSKSKATNIMNAMKAAKVIKKVTGYGSGRYEFIEL